jgi:serine/threonine protein kinase
MSDALPGAGGPASPDPAASTGPAPPALEPDAQWPVIPGYEILGRLAPGGMGVVYRARQVALNRTVALKMIRTGADAGAQERARFRVEAEAIAALSHPHVIPIYDFGEWNGEPYLAMEFAEGGSLARRLAGRPMAPPEAAALVETLAQAMHFVHERGVIHRDLKPANILLQTTEHTEYTEKSQKSPSVVSGIPKIADFGLAKRLDRDEGLTRTHTVLGTASYMAPEQAAGDPRAIGPAADVYALGAILYECLTGQPPFRAATYELIVHQLLSEEPLPPGRLRPEVPADLDAICLKCLLKDPKQRFSSALVLADDLRRHLDGDAISIESSGPHTWHGRLARRAGYEIVDLPGASDRGPVYRARQRALNRVVALQFLEVDGDRAARLRADIETVARLHHVNLVEVYDFGETPDGLYVATEYVPGGSLAEWHSGASRSPEEPAAVVETLARAVHCAHQKGLVHGGLRPSCVRLAADGTAKVTGLGLAAVFGDAAATPATDVHALGAVLHELLCGRPPDLPRRALMEAPSGLEAICARCLETDPSARYPTAAALAEDLRRFRSGEVLFIDDLDTWPHQQRWARRAGYEVLEVLGRSPDAFSYKARQLALDRIVVLKRIAARHRFVPAAKARFGREGHLLAGLRHPNIVRLYDQGEQSDLAYFAREFVSGRSLAEQAAEGPLPIPTAVELAATLARAVHVAHVRGIVHGGLSPDCIHVTPAGLPRITSFRSARVPPIAADESRPASEVRRLAGYLTPEQVERGNRGLGPASDVHALGAILYTLLTGQPPFPGPTLAEVLEQVRSQAALSPRQRQPAVPLELEAICLKCLSKKPSQRPAGAAELADDLTSFARRR